MDATTCCRAPCWTETALVSAQNIADARVLTVTSVYLDGCTFNYDLSRQIPCSPDGDSGTFSTEQSLCSVTNKLRIQYAADTIWLSCQSKVCVFGRPLLWAICFFVSAFCVH